MNERESVLAQYGIDAVNKALLKLGCPTISADSDICMAPPVIGDIPNAIVRKPRVAPFRIVFGRELNIWIGPYSEVVTVAVTENTRGLMEETITRVLMSEVLCSFTKRSVKLIIQIPDQEPWTKLRVHGMGLQPSLEPRYEPYARG